MLNQICKDKTRIHYQLFHNLFLYVTERCQLRCEHCYMGDRLQRGLTMSLERAATVMKFCRKLGTRYITFVGGEPTLHPDLPVMVSHAKTCGFDKIYIDTNGLRPSDLRRIPPEQLTYVRVSLDGASAKTHDKIRGEGTFEKTIRSIRELIHSGYQVAITSTVFKFSIDEAPRLLDLAADLGIALVNYHVFSEEGAGAQKSDWSLSPEDWIAFYERIERVKQQNISIWYPPSWATPERLAIFVQEGFRGCLGCALDRLSVFPDGKCYVCSVLFDFPVHFGVLDETGFCLNREANEFELFTQAAFSAREPWMSGCPAESLLKQRGNKKPIPDTLTPICRCWKRQI